LSLADCYPADRDPRARWWSAGCLSCRVTGEADDGEDIVVGARLGRGLLRWLSDVAQDAAPVTA
jgi:hypothetical protein